MPLSKNHGRWIGAAIVVLAGVASTRAQDAKAAVTKPLRDLEQERRDIMDAHRGEFGDQYRRIVAEFNEPGAPDWAGTYCASDSWCITVAPKSGVAYSCSACTAQLDLNYGAIREIRPDGLTVDFRIDLALNLPWARLGREMPALSSRLYFVNWGERRYLIPATQMIPFCNEWNSRTLGSAYFPLLRSDAGSRPERDEPPLVAPSVPSEFRAYLLDAPITGRIRRILETIDHVDSKSEPWREIRATVDVSEDARVLRGMGFWIQGRPNSWMGEVLETRGTESTVAFRCPNGGTGGSPLTFPEIGDAVSTRKQERARGR